MPNAKRAKVEVEVEVEVKVPAVAPEVEVKAPAVAVAVAPDVAEVAVPLPVPQPPQPPNQPPSNERILDMVLRALSTDINMADVDAALLPGQRGLFFLDAEEDVALVVYSLADRCGSGSPALRFRNLLDFVLAEARTALPAARLPDLS